MTTHRLMVLHRMAVHRVAVLLFSKTRLSVQEHLLNLNIKWCGNFEQTQVSFMLRSSYLSLILLSYAPQMSEFLRILSEPCDRLQESIAIYCLLCSDILPAGPLDPTQPTSHGGHSTVKSGRLLVCQVIRMLSVSSGAGHA